MIPPVVGLSLEGPEARQKGGPMMTSSYSANRDKHFRSSLRYGHRRIRSWEYGMTYVAEGKNAKECSWYKSLKTLKVGKTRLATRKSWATASWHRPHFFIFSQHFSAFVINKPFENVTLSPLIKCFVVGKLNLFTVISSWCCNLSGGVALIVWFTTNRICVKNNTIICVARANNSKRDCEHDLCCCLLPRCEALRTCRSGFPIATMGIHETINNNQEDLKH